MNNVICGLGAGICEAVCAVTPVEPLGRDRQRVDRGASEIDGKNEREVRSHKKLEAPGVLRDELFGLGISRDQCILMTYDG